MSKRKRREIKPFDELTITDDFMFGAVMSDPENLKPLLEFILDIKIDHITYPERQKVIDLNYETKSIRLDVYCEDDQKTVYSIEIQVTDKKNLAKRIRYYRDMIDLNILDKGEDFRKLPKCFIIFICCYEPFGRERYKYTFMNQCQEEQNLYLGDDTAAIVLNVNGTIGEICSELKSTMHYMAGHDPEDEYSRRLDNAVKKVKANEKWRRDYMTFAMKMKESNELTMLATIISTVKEMRGQLDNDKIAKFLHLDMEQLNAIFTQLDQTPDMDEWDIANTILFG